MAEVQGVKSGAARCACSHQMKGVIDRPAGQILRGGEVKGILIFRRTERNQCEMFQDGGVDQAAGIGGKQPGFDREGGQGGEKFGQGVRGEMSLRAAFPGCPKMREGGAVVRVLLEECCHQHGGIEANLHSADTSRLR